ncbi:SHOCT domain-containing protein [Salinisphaera sp. T31B1]|uniref:SHOCT domain-containing protein n=1 Tax=Salinisphaera sp. T31B1 TaxID=727963 RepID=UPI003340DEAB
MADTDPEHDAQLADFAERFGFSQAAVRHLSDAVSDGGGDMAMFDHTEFAGPGQWMRGGLIMITDPANHVLKNRIDALCNALSEQLRRTHAGATRRHRRIEPDARAWDTGPAVHDHWWPSELGEPSVSGRQNDLAYAYFDAARRLAIRRGERIAVYDTGDHRITGVAQADADIRAETVFTSQLGEVSLGSLARCDSGNEDTSQASAAPRAGSATGQSTDEILSALERLGELQRQGVLTEAEFAAKKQALLDRL